MKPIFANGSPDALRTACEDLRARALAGDRGPGAAMFLRHGMYEWIEVCSSSTAAVAVTEPVAAAANPQLLPPGMRSEIVAILASMFLKKQWEATR